MDPLLFTAAIIAGWIVTGLLGMMMSLLIDPDTINDRATWVLAVLCGPGVIVGEVVWVVLRWLSRC